MRCLGLAGHSASEALAHTIIRNRLHTHMRAPSSICSPTFSAAPEMQRPYAMLPTRRSMCRRRANRCRWVHSHWRSTSRHWSRTTRRSTDGAATSRGRALADGTPCSSAPTSVQGPALTSATDSSTQTRASVSAPIMLSTSE